MSVYIVPVGIQKTRLQIMQKGTSKIGLKLTLTYNNQVKYVVSELEDYESVAKVLKVGEGDIIKATVVRSLWFFDSLKAGSPLPCTTYLLKHNKVIPVQENVRERKFLCQAPTSSNHKNKELVKALEVLAEEAEFKTDDGESSRAIAFRRAAGALKQFPTEVTKIEELDQLSDIGAHARTVVQEILEESFSQEVNQVLTSEWFKTVKLFCGIYGIGPSTANRWYGAGFKTLADIRNNPNVKLDERSQYGLEYYDDLTSPVKKKEAEQIFKIVSEETTKLLPDALLYLMGGFSRGKELGHDVDILISHPQEGREDGLLAKLSYKLQSKGFVVHQNIQYKINNPKGARTMDNFDKSFIIFKLFPDDTNEVLNSSLDRGKWFARRVDLIVCPLGQLPFAKMGWTGSKWFNRSVRHYAKKKLKLKLTNHGLYDYMKNTYISVASEEELFSKLKLNYLKPCERNL